MALGGTPAEHCERAKEYATELFADIREARKLIKSAYVRDPDARRRAIRAAHRNVSTGQTRLDTELRWVEDDCKNKDSVQVANRAAMRLKSELWNDGDLGFYELGNLWPLYLMAGSIGWWYWKNKDERASEGGMVEQKEVEVVTRRRRRRKKA